MKEIGFTLSLLFISSASCTFAQDAIVVKTKDRQMLKIDKMVERINGDTSLIQFISHDFNTYSILYNTPTWDTSSTVDNLKIIVDDNWDPYQSKAIRFYKKDSEIVRISFKNEAYYYVNEKLLLSVSICSDKSNDNLQCRPGLFANYHYYWKGIYYKSYFETVIPGNCGCSYLSMAKCTKDGERLILKLKSLPLESKTH